MLLAGVASAATVAVLDFDGYAVSFSDAQTVAQGVRDAFLEGGKLDPLSGSDIADGVSKGQDDTLRRARELVSEGRRRYAGGDATGALPDLAEALRLHNDAWSDVGRRPELADASFLYGLCLLKAGRSTEAKERFAQAAFLVPHYAAERGTRMPSDAAALLSAAEDALTRGPKKARIAADVGAIADILGVDYVVTGWVNGEGAVSARLYAGDRLLSEAKVMLEERPPLPFDGGYGELTTRLVSAGLGGGATVAAADVPEDDLEPGDEDIGPPPDFDEDEPDAAPRRGNTTPRVSTTRGNGGSGTTKTKISTPGAMRYDQGPITQRWWFWTGAVAVAGGGAFGVWYALSDPPVEYQEEPDTWSVTIQTE